MTRRLATAFAVDAVVVLAFAGVGRRNHDESSGLAGVLGTAAPFLCALAVMWGAAVVITRARRQEPLALLNVDAGVILAIGTVALGMLARRTLWDRGTALAFVIVTAAFLTCFMGVWRAVWVKLRQRRSSLAS